MSDATPTTTVDLFGHYVTLVADIAATDDTAYQAAIQTYVAASSGDKGRMRAYVTKVAQQVMLALDPSDEAAVARVKALVAIQPAQSDAVGTATKAPADPRVDAAVTIAALIGRATMALGDLDGDLSDLAFVADLVTMATGVDPCDLFARVDAIGLPTDVRTYADRIKVPTGRRNAAPGGDIAAHIYEALTQAPEGTALTVAQIRAAETEAYPQGAPSGGAISARLFPRDGRDCTVDGVTPVMVNGVMGARLSN